MTLASIWKALRMGKRVHLHLPLMQLVLLILHRGCNKIALFCLFFYGFFLQLSDNMSLHLDTLLNSSTADFWASGLVFVMDRRQLAFMHNGQIMLDRALAPSSHHYCKILRVRSVAAPYHATINFRVVGLNLFSTSSRLICLFEGRCIFQEDTDTVADDAECEDREIDCLSFCCFVPGRRGRGVIEVEDSGFSNGFFPFVVSENDVCSEVSELEIQKSWFICNGAGVVCCDKNAVIFYLYWPC
ncbi:hypothetical protein BS78_K313200 [Paspalum vaginatum]|uniref:Uncharacterized protein n=1 Tax=Paspalum vaginatum TaxID=158149 RepID=A0A9W7XB54_9POAL|nr:hypothetical protein BS78_K313200 [Paspalum vaginatum]